MNFPVGYCMQRDPAAASAAPLCNCELITTLTAVTIDPLFSSDPRSPRAMVMGHIGGAFPAAISALITEWGKTDADYCLLFAEDVPLALEGSLVSVYLAIPKIGGGADTPFHASRVIYIDLLGNAIVLEEKFGRTGCHAPEKQWTNWVFYPPGVWPIVVDTFEELTIRYEWDGEPDLDSGTTFAGETVGYGHPSLPIYLTWTGDITSVDGFETVVVNLPLAEEDDVIPEIMGQLTATIQCAADWYPPAGGSGPATIKVTYKGVVYEHAINPGSVTPSTTLVLTITIKKDGTVTFFL